MEQENSSKQEISFKQGGTGKIVFGLFFVIFPLLLLLVFVDFGSSLADQEFVPLLVAGVFIAIGAFTVLKASEYNVSIRKHGDSEVVSRKIILRKEKVETFKADQVTEIGYYYWWKRSRSTNSMSVNHYGEVSAVFADTPELVLLSNYRGVVKISSPFSNNSKEPFKEEAHEIADFLGVPVKES